MNLKETEPNVFCWIPDGQEVTVEQFQQILSETDYNGATGGTYQALPEDTIVVHLYKDGKDVACYHVLNSSISECRPIWRKYIPSEFLT